VLPAATERILRELPEDALVLDVGGWAAPLNRADWVLDLMPWETRGAIGSYGPGPERFSAQTWAQRDMCAHEPWPFADDQFDFAVCATTLEDVRDPIWVCREMARVARAGYVEVPTLLAELILDVQGRGPWLGHDHHRWICRVDADASEIVFVHKAHSIHADPRLAVPPAWAARLDEAEHLQGMFWTGTFSAREEVHVDVAFPLDEWAREVSARFGGSRARRAAALARYRLGRARGRLSGRRRA
jgi:hypothetical protein